MGSWKTGILVGGKFNKINIKTKTDPLTLKADEFYEKDGAVAFFIPL